MVRSSPLYIGIATSVDPSELGTRESSVQVVPVESPFTVPFTYYPEDLILAIAEQTKMNDCYFEKKDWRVCKDEACQKRLLLPLPYPVSDVYFTNLKKHADDENCARWSFFGDAGKNKATTFGQRRRMLKPQTNTITYDHLNVWSSV